LVIVIVLDGGFGGEERSRVARAQRLILRIEGQCGAIA
jgi:hypothetical protein